MIGPYQHTRWIEAKATVAVPSFGVVRITGASWENPSRTVLTVNKPAVASDYPVAVNSHKPIAAGDYGLVAVEGVVYAQYDSASTPANQERWGTQAASFKLKKGQTGFIILGDVDAAKGIVLVGLDAAGGTGQLVGGCLHEDHPGRGTVFEIELGTWSSSSHSWSYSTVVKAIDWRFGVPYPATGSTGLFQAMPSDTYGTIYETVALDCASPGACGS